MAALRFIVGTVLDLYILTFILRFLLQWVRISSSNPFWHFILRVTDPIVQPLRRVVPGWRGLELVSPIVVLVLEVVAIIVLSRLASQGMPPLLAVLGIAFIRVFLGVLQLYTVALLVYVLLSWISPGVSNQLSRVLAVLCEPLLRPVRRILPVIGGFDLSPLVVMIALQAITISVRLPPYLLPPY